MSEVAPAQQPKQQKPKMEKQPKPQAENAPAPEQKDAAPEQKPAVERQPKGERKPREERPPREERKPKEEKKHLDKDGKEIPRKANPRFDAMKLKQQPIMAQVAKNFDQIKKLSDEISLLQKTREGKFIPLNSENRDQMKKLSEQLKVFRVQQDELKLKFDEAVAKVQILREKVPKSVSNDEQARKEIEQMTYILEHDSHSTQEEKQLKAKISALEKSIAFLPQLEQMNKEISGFKAQQKAIRDQMKPLLDEKSVLLDKQQKENEKILNNKTETGDINAKIDALFNQRKELYAKNDELKAQCDAIYKEYEKEQDSFYEEMKAKKAKMAVRDEMTPMVEELIALNVRVFEEPRWSGNFEVTFQFQTHDADPLAQAKAGMITYLESLLVAKKVEEAQEKELTKEEKKKLRQQKNRGGKVVDFSSNMWMDELKIKAEDIDTDEKKLALIEKLKRTEPEADKEAEKLALQAKADAILEQLKGKGATIVIKTHVEAPAESQKVPK